MRYDRSPVAFGARLAVELQPATQRVVCERFMELPINRALGWKTLHLPPIVAAVKVFEIAHGKQARILMQPSSDA